MVSERRIALIAVSLFASIAIVGAAAAAGEVTERVSVGTDGTQGNDMSGRLSPPALSADGRIVAFDSVATNLVRGDTNRQADIFVHDRETGRTNRVSVASDGRQGNDLSRSPALSATGRFVAFESLATNLVPGDTNHVQDIFVCDRLTGQTRLVSVALNGGPADGTSLGAAISGDGRYVVFASDATNLIPGGGILFGRDVYVRDLLAGVTELVSGDASGRPTGSNAPGDISGDGRIVAFGSFSSTLVPGDTNDVFDVFVRDRVARTTVRASVDSSGKEGNDSSTNPRISADGHVVAFGSNATNLVPGDTNNRRDVFVHELATHKTERVSVNGAGEQSNGDSEGPGIRGGLSWGPDISRHGRYVAFDSNATNLVPGDTNVAPDMFVRDRFAGTTVRVSVNSTGAQGGGGSTDPAMNHDGSVVAFFSSAPNLVPGDTNLCPTFLRPGTCPDIFVHAR